MPAEAAVRPHPWVVHPPRLLAGLTGLVALVPLLLTTAAAPAAADPEVSRLSGTDRFSTAVAVSRASHPRGAGTVVLTTGLDFPDALAGGPAAAELGGPVLLVAKDAVPDVVLAELDRLAPQRVLLLGGTGAVSEQAEAQLTEAGLDVQRLAGAGRYDTAALVSRTVFTPGVPVAYVATGTDYPDALAGAAAAGRAGAPVLLTGRDTLPPATRSELLRLLPQRIVVLGGTGAVSAQVEQQLRGYSLSVSRIAGADRYATATAIAQSVPGRPDALYLATGQGFADALAGGPAAAAANAPVLLVPPTCIPGSVHNEMERHGFPPVTLLGGPAALGSDVAWLRPCFRAPDGQLAPGVTLRTLADRRGPWSGKIVSVAPEAAWRLDTVLAQDALPGLETTSAMARRTGAVVAVNGDFALAGGRPVHAFGKDGRLVQTPQLLGRNVAVESRTLTPKLGFPRVKVEVAVPDTGATAPVTRVNAGGSGFDGLALSTPQGGAYAPYPQDTCAARIRTAGVPALDGDGRTLQAYDVVATRCDGEELAGSDELLTSPVAGEHVDLLRDLQPGQRISLSWSVGWRDVLDTLGGNPTLLEDGAVVDGNVDGTDPFSARNPRTAVGYKADGTVLIVTVDGRGADGSVGMTLRELARLFVELGATDALNLDGGGSTTMVIGGEVQNRPSDGPERAVSTALVLVPGSGPGSFSTQSRTSTPPVPLSAEEEGSAQSRLLSDPGSTGGLTGG